MRKLTYMLLALLLHATGAYANQDSYEFHHVVTGLQGPVSWSISQNSYTFPNTIQFAEGVTFDINTLLLSSDPSRFRPEFNSINLNGFSFDQSTGLVTLQTQNHGSKSGQIEVSGHGKSETLTLSGTVNPLMQMVQNVNTTLLSNGTWF